MSNSANAEQAFLDREFQGQQARDQRQFSHEEAGTQRNWASEEAAKARGFTEEMSSTAYQRQVADMTKAGINPMLAIMKGGGASTPSASAPSGASASPGGLPGGAHAKMENVFSNSFVTFFKPTSAAVEATAFSICLKLKALSIPLPKTFSILA